MTDIYVLSSKTQNLLKMYF